MEELINLRKPREKHYLNTDGTITAHIYDNDVHYLSNGKYEEIDNTLVELDDCYSNNKNDFKVDFYKDRFLINLSRSNYYLKISLLSDNVVENIFVEKNSFKYIDIIDKVDFIYELFGKRLKETIVLKENVLKEIKFKINTNLELKCEDNMLKAINNEERVFEFFIPYMKDSQDSCFYNCNYTLIKEDDFYILTLTLDEDWLRRAKFPVMVDPTISNENDKVYDTYIYLGDEGIDKNSQDVLKIGTDSNNTSYRILTKFELPKLGTGASIISAIANYTTHPDEVDVLNDYQDDYIGVYKITSDWDENTATWNTMHDKYDNYMQEYSLFDRTKKITDGNKITKNLVNNSIDITSMVREWYNGLPNNGFMLKMINEKYDSTYPIHMLCSKENSLSNTLGENPRPYLIINYRIRNGKYDDMISTSFAVSCGNCCTNILNGNENVSLSLASIDNGEKQTDLLVSYNTNDIVINNSKIPFLAKGWRFNYDQVISKITIDSIDYLEYIDGFGVSYFFYSNNGQYYSEDNKPIEILINNDSIELTDNNKIKYIFKKYLDYYYLSEVVHKDEKVNIIRNSNNAIIEVNDNKEDKIIITYHENKVDISTETLETSLDITNNQLNSIESKFGLFNITYNDNGLIECITDVDSQKLKFDYYPSVPYKIKNIAKHGCNDGKGLELSFEYDYFQTTVQSSQGSKGIYSFDKLDRLLGVLSYDNGGLLKDTSGYSNTYEVITNEFIDADNPTYTVENKKIKSSIEMKPIINLLTEDIFFQNINTISSTEKIKKEENDDYVIKVSDDINCKIFDIKKEGYYTFSGFFKSSLGSKINITLGNGEKIFDQIEVSSNNTFERYSLSGYFDKESQLYLSVTSNDCVYIEKIQLEYGNVTNLYNYVQNPCFDYGTQHWQITARDIDFNDYVYHGIEEINEEEKVYHIKNDPNVTIRLSNTVNHSGKKGDLFNLSFLYKNGGNHNKSKKELFSTGVNVTLRFYSNNTESGSPEKIVLNKNTLWQVFNYSFEAPYDYYKIVIEVESKGEINDLYLAYFSLLQGISSLNTEKNEKGQIKEVQNYNGDILKFKYDNELLSSIEEKNLGKMHYEYDLEKSDQIINCLSNLDIKQNIDYDDKGKVRKVNISSIKGDSSFYIRVKGTHKYLTPNLVSKRVELKENVCNLKSYIINIVDGKSTIALTEIPEYYLCIYNNEVIFKKTTTPSIFEFVKDEKDYIKIKEINSDKILTYNNGEISIGSNNENSTFDFCLEGFKNPEFFETNYLYGGNNMSKTFVDSLCNEHYYEFDELTGLLKLRRNPNQIDTIFTYDEKNRIVSMSKNNKTVTYEYNIYNKISKILTGEKVFEFEYDEFLNIKSILLNNTELMNLQYNASTGKVVIKTFGNGDIINYEYDESGRINKIEGISANNENECIQYYYDNFGNLVKIKTNENESEFTYDIINRITKSRINKEFECYYDYNSNDIVSSFIVRYLNKLHSVEYNYNHGGVLENTNVRIDNTNIASIGYDYDYLGRIKNTKINDEVYNSVEYLSKGNRTSSVVKKYIVGSDIYEYQYNKLNNIEKIILNGTLKSSYVYDNFERLMSENNYDLNNRVDYVYDLEGNIQSVNTYDLENNSLITSDNYAYDNNYQDQLIRFNDKIITYDGIGNPLSIGEATLKWNMGRRLIEYTKNNNNIKFEYDYDGYRTKKVVNNLITKYCYEDSKLILENKNGEILRYIYDEVSGLIGFIYNDEMYYYKKNNQNDIIGILNENLLEVVSYNYDSWGKLLNVSGTTPENYDIGLLNPFRYRCYYYDSETELYYLKDRYYSPTIRRFLNMDVVLNSESTVDGFNLYAYVTNNPINKFDPNGNFSLFNGIKNAINKVVKAATTIVKTVKKYVASIPRKIVNKLTVKSNTKTNSCLPFNSKKTVSSPSINIGIAKIKIVSESTVSCKKNSFISTSIDKEVGKELYDMNLGVGPVNFSAGDSGLGLKVKIPLPSDGSAVVSVNFDGKPSWSAPLGNISFSGGYDNGSNETSINVETSALGFAFALAYQTVEVKVESFVDSAVTSGIEAIKGGFGIIQSGGDLLRRGFSYTFAR